MHHLENDLKKNCDVPYEAAAAYERLRDTLVKEVNQTLSEHPNIDVLIGDNPLRVMEENHKNHFEFMVNVFKLNQCSLLVRTSAWVYHSYRARGFSYDYFPAVYKAWIFALKNNLEPHLAEPLVKVYSWLFDNHNQIIELSRSELHKPSFQIEGKWKDLMDSFLSMLLKGDHRGCLKIADNTVDSPENLKKFYLQILQPALYRIGEMWEKGEISVAHEHLASAIVSRVMANLYPQFVLTENTRGKAIITASPNEYHEIGARMVADFLEIDGWDVKYLGSSVPEEELIKILKEDNPLLLGISAAMPFNIDKTKSIISAVRNLEPLKNIKIMVGGKVFSEDPSLWKSVGADGWAVDGGDAAEKALMLLEEK